MKLYQTQQAPNPRRVRMFAHEVGVELALIELDLARGDNLKPELLVKNPSSKIPFLELDDGTCIGETVAICRYLAAVAGDHSLFGKSPLEQALIEMHHRQIELYFMNVVGMGFQHSTGYFKDRMTPNPSWGEQCINSAHSYLKRLEKHFTDNDYAAGDTFSIADITLLCSIDFARVIKVRLTEEHPNLQNWYKQISQRPSASV
ncbi:glutathione S-transferase family protein [Paraferrimonas sp. SM1919]|uniref:glutathione S-transferase family protein n=1 Tax=Paraferrimonas sp. SM1919 TaxID=2662263 RepID=UPI0013D2789D|nr:glutathione S-transferase family protein [Paraferrimonas sp. SM1919]